MIPLLPHISLCYDWCDEQTDDWTGGLRKNMNILLNAPKNKMDRKQQLIHKITVLVTAI